VRSRITGLCLPYGMMQGCNRGLLSPFRSMRIRGNVKGRRYNHGLSTAYGLCRIWSLMGFHSPYGPHRGKRHDHRLCLPYRSLHVPAHSQKHVFTMPYIRQWLRTGDIERECGRRDELWPNHSIPRYQWCDTGYVQFVGSSFSRRNGTLFGSVETESQQER